MLEISRLRQETNQVLEGLARRHFTQAPQLVRDILQLDEERRQTQHQLNEQQAQARQLAKQIGQWIKEGQSDAAQAAKAQTAELKADLKAGSETLQNIEDKLQKLLYELPNVPHPSVKAGKGEQENEVIFSMPEPAPAPAPHWELIEKFDLIDFELGNKISGAGFPVYKGRGAKLQRALIAFFLDQASEAGYQEIQPPLLVNEASGIGTGQLPDKEGQMYHVTADDLYLIPTAEVPLTNLYRDTILEQHQLPIKLAGYTPCFRREAGSWGAHVRGLNRLHQFDKVEIVQITDPTSSYATLEQMRDHIQGLLLRLGLPFRILRLCGGDLGFTSALTYDFEVYSAGQQRWLEVSSVSNFETFQANRLKLRYKDDQNKKHLAHTLNGSALALPRIVAALLENNYDGKHIHLPLALQPYCGFETMG
ncbi:MAG: serine--tRNA ligase [Bernardetiaceae bacterium]